MPAKDSGKKIGVVTSNIDEINSDALAANLAKALTILYADRGIRFTSRSLRSDDIHSDRIYRTNAEYQ